MRPSEGGGGGARFTRSQTIWVIVAVSLGVFVYRSQELSDRAVARSSKEIAQLREALTELEDRLAQSSRRVRHIPFETGGSFHAPLEQAPLPPSEEPTTKPPQDEQADSEDGDGTPPPRTLRSTIEEVAPFLETLEESYQADPVDASWSHASKDALQHFWLPKLPPGSRLDAVDCRSTVCRVESTFESEPQMNEFVYAALSDPARRPWNGGMTVGPVRQDPVSKRITMVTFLMRETAPPEGATAEGVAAVH